MNKLNPDTLDRLSAIYPKQAAGIERLSRQLSTLAPSVQAGVLRTLMRYLNEGQNKSYQADPSSLVSLIQDEGLFANAEQIFDLGAGPGDLLNQLSKKFPNAQSLGIDLSPSFVDNYNLQNPSMNSRMELGIIDTENFWQEFRISPDNQCSAVSVLTLDRLATPLGVIKNMARCNRSLILATLLPVVAEDDNPSLQAQKIVYTDPDQRIVPGRNLVEDRDALLRTLRSTWARNVEIATVPYEVKSAGDLQSYDLYVFYTTNSK